MEAELLVRPVLSALEPPLPCMQVWAAVANLTAAAGQQDPSLRAPALVAVDLPCTMFAVHTRSSLALAGQVALSLEWSPVVRALAERVVERLSEGGTRPYNGAHLRLERDASHWKRILGGQRVRSWVWDGGEAVCGQLRPRACLTGC